ncbi:MAG: PTS sugar transporter subunit IIC [Clostridia bacterium]|nr:PTS sugar transporter subunit IIC [Clostridia bacterium]MBQ9994502.1 PTS sugar transporter subunit IIC [Clostridia bacterium]
MAKSESAIASFFKKKGISFNPKVYFIDAMGAMAFGLFASLLIGTIFGKLADWTSSAFIGTMAKYATDATGAAIGIAISHSMGATGLVLYSNVAVGMAGYVLGGPVGTYVSVVISTLVGKLISKETKLDILVTPTLTLATGIAVARWIGPILDSVMRQIGELINATTAMHPFVMGILVSVSMGIILTLPISSAALCAMIAISGLAGGAATAGCCAHMIGFAVISYRDNNIGASLAQGLGTSMVQMPNIIRHPFIALPVILTSAVTGPIATMVFGMKNTGVSAGMGTCGLVGPLGVVTSTPGGGLWMWLGIICVCFLIPAFLTPIFDAILRKMGLIRDGAMKLEAGV